MGFAKRQMEQDWEDRGVAIEVLKRARVVGVCEVHEEAYDNYGDIQAAYRLVNWLITAGNDLVAGFDGDRGRATDAIQGAHNEMPLDCHICAKHADE